MNKEKPYLVIHHNLQTNGYNVLGSAGLSLEEAEKFAHERAVADRENEVLICKAVTIFAVNKPEVKRYELEE